MLALRLPLRVLMKPSHLMKNLLKSKAILALLVLAVIAILVIVLFNPITNVVVGTGLFRSWLTGQIESQSSGKFTYETISGTVHEMTLTGVKLENTPGRLLRTIETPKLIAHFELVPLLMFKLQLKDVAVEGGRIEASLASAKSEDVRLPLSLTSVKVTGASVNVSDFSGWTLELANASFEKTNQPDSSDVFLKADSAQLGRITLEKLETSVTLGNDKVAVKALKASLFGGALDLKGSLQVATGNSFQDTALTLTGFETGSALSTLGYSQAISGKATLDLPGVTGTWTPSTTNFNGKGKVTLDQVSAKAQLPSIPGFDSAPIFKALQPVAGLGGPIDFELQGTSISLSPTTLQHPQAKVEINGTVNLDKTIALKGRLLASPALADGIPAMGKNLFEKDGEGQTVIPFDLVGTTDNFKADIGNVVGKVLSNPLNVVPNPLNIFK
jgi:hypothetical protein